MDLTIHPRKLSGQIEIIPSKSLAHRYLICAAFAKTPTAVICREAGLDVQATADCLNGLGAKISRTADGFHVVPVQNVAKQAVLPCGESGSTLRFLLPVVGALGVDATFLMEGRLPKRPLSPLWEEMERMGCTLSRPTENTIRCNGKLRGGDYSVPGNVSSQFITGLHFALPLLDTDSNLRVTGKLESKPYITMTVRAMELFDYPGSPSPGSVTVEGDWSNGAFWLAANALGNNVEITNLSSDSAQGDRIAEALIPALQEHQTIDISDIPDLAPILAVVAAANQGATFTNIHRLRLKESDRVASTVAMIESLGGQAEVSEDTLTIHGTGLIGGTVDSHNDHRIAMAAAIAATVCRNPVTVIGADAVEKSYPQFWDEYRRLGGEYEQYLR